MTATCIRFRLGAHGAWLAMLAMAIAPAGPALGLDDIEAVLAHMAAERAAFDPAPLLKMGPDAVTALFDRLFPETAPRAPVPELGREQAARLVAQLGAPEYKQRESATHELARTGRRHAELVKQAAQSPDPEVRLRAKSILAAWDQTAKMPRPKDPRFYEDALGRYFDRLKDPEAWLRVAERTRLALQQKGKLDKGQRRILSLSLAAVGKIRKDQYSDVFTPLLDDPREWIAVWVVRTIGAHSGNDYFPALLLKALRSEREAVVVAALTWTPKCQDKDRADEVKRLVSTLFETGNETLKLHAAFTLMQSYGNKHGTAYILSQTRNPDVNLARKAVYWIGDACNSAKPAYPELLEHLLPLLKSEDFTMKRAAAYALGTYQGEPVIGHLIPLLADEEATLRAEVRMKLLEQPDTALLKQLLRRAAEHDEAEKVRHAATDLLRELEKGE
ncbi:MAG: HEAT repeat domain-containing protein [Kiritimatiellae bacterium]|nr:HEAT repeat domain-containing protein [Kiritimatiellia bacterium]